MRYILVVFLLLSSFLVKADIISGNTKGAVTLIEYFDYNCPVCRGFEPIIDELRKHNPNLRVIQR